MKERFENEANKTKIKGSLHKREILANEDKNAFDLNFGHKPRIIESMDSSSFQKQSSYFN